MQVELESPRVPGLQADTKPSSQASHLPLQRADSLDPPLLPEANPLPKGCWYLWFNIVQRFLSLPLNRIPFDFASWYLRLIASPKKKFCLPFQKWHPGLNKMKCSSAELGWLIGSLLSISSILLCVQQLEHCLKIRKTLWPGGMSL